MAKALLLLLLILSGVAGYSQASLDSIMNALNNKDVYVSPIIYGVYIGPIARNINKDSALANKRLFIVSSFEEGIREVAKKYSRNDVIEKLYFLLQDTTRDFYANALLYDLLDNRKLGKLMGLSRKSWIESGRKATDEQHWDEFMKKEIFIHYKLITFLYYRFRHNSNCV